MGAHGAVGRAPHLFEVELWGRKRRGIRVTRGDRRAINLPLTRASSGVIVAHCAREWLIPSQTARKRITYLDSDLVLEDSLRRINSDLVVGLGMIEGVNKTLRRVKGFATTDSISRFNPKIKILEVNLQVRQDKLRGSYKAIRTRISRRMVLRIPVP